MLNGENLEDTAPRCYSGNKRIIHKVGDAVREYRFDLHALILQVNNCVACKVHKNSFGGVLYEALPYSSPYNRRRLPPFNNLSVPQDRSVPGTIAVKYPPQYSNGPVVCCLFGQYDMGDGSRKYFAKSRFVDSEYLAMLKKDTKEFRFQYFKMCLKELVLQLKTPSMAIINKIIIPKFIGCGLGGGSWKKYYLEILEFSENVNIDVYVVEKK